MQLARGDQRRHAAVHVVGDPRKRILRRRVFANRRMRMRIDQTGNRRDSVRIDDAIGLATDAVADFLDYAVFDQERVGGSQWRLEITGNERTDIFDQDRRHARTISKRLENQKWRRQRAPSGCLDIHPDTPVER